MKSSKVIKINYLRKQSKTLPSMKETIEILEEKPYGFVVRNHTKKVKQVLPKKYLQKKVLWGMYEIINSLAFKTSLQLA